MTVPNGESGINPPDFSVTDDGSIPGLSDRTQPNAEAFYKGKVQASPSWAASWPIFGSVINAFIGGALDIVLGGFATVLDAILGTVDDDYVAALPIINDHSQSITDIQDALEVLVLQGQAVKFITNGTYTPSAGIVAVEVILIGAGAGGASGRWDLVPANTRGGGGGSGGAEVHYLIPAANLPQTGGVFDSIAITVGAFGAGGAGTAVPGTGGGSTSFGSFLTAGGGVGGVAQTNPSTAGATAAGGEGMINGGDGGRSAWFDGSTTFPATAGSGSVSGFTLNGGGGGGGAGYNFRGPGSNGGQGGISPGGTYTGGAGNAGSAPSAVVATGGGGGAGGGAGGNGGAGGYPGGGGGGGGANGGNPQGNGGNGANGALYVIERSGDVVGI